MISAARPWEEATSIVYTYILYLQATSTALAASCLLSLVVILFLCNTYEWVKSETELVRTDRQTDAVKPWRIYRSRRIRTCMHGHR
jgi:hypothetical protein